MRKSKKKRPFLYRIWKYLQVTATEVIKRESEFLSGFICIHSRSCKIDNQKNWIPIFILFSALVFMFVMFHQFQPFSNCIFQSQPRWISSFHNGIDRPQSKVWVKAQASPTWRSRDCTGVSSLSVPLVSSTRRSSTTCSQNSSRLVVSRGTM